MKLHRAPIIGGLPDHAHFLERLKAFKIAFVGHAKKFARNAAARIAEQDFPNAARGFTHLHGADLDDLRLHADQLIRDQRLDMADRAAVFVSARKILEQILHTMDRAAPEQVAQLWANTLHKLYVGIKLKRHKGILRCHLRLESQSKRGRIKDMTSEKYMKIRLGSLPPAQSIPFDLYVSIGGRYVHYLRAGDKLKAAKIASFEKKAPDSFYIAAANRAAYQKFVRDGLMSEDLSTKQKALILRESTMVLVEELFERPDIETALSDARQVIEDFVAFMDSDASAMANLIGLSSHDFYTYNHSLDVSIYSLGLGFAVGFKDHALKELGLGGLFHDIGKRHIPLEIICKEGPLTESEWALMQKHPQYGLIILNEHQTPDNIKACAFEHHESMAGNGYPQKLMAREIHPMAKVVAVADTYDALTTKRSYNAPMKPTDAIELMAGKLSGKYDPEVIKALMAIFHKLKNAA